MAADVDLEEQQKNPDISFVLNSGLLIFSRMQNRALGIEIDTQFESLLLKESYQLLKQIDKNELNKTAQMAMLRGMITSYTNQIDNLINNAETIEQQRKILPVVIKLQEKQELATKLLENLTNG